METKHIKIFSFILFLLLGVSSVYSQPSDTVDNEKMKNDSIASMEKFRQELSTKGQWIKVDTSEIDADNQDVDQIDEDLNREYVWRPDNVGYEWNPYEYGCWQYTSCGWMWVSYYDFGWTTCHYGRWWWSVNYGWVWSPGYIWAPAWVSWCYYDNYCGWYPISPRCHWGHGHGHGYDTEHHHWRERNWTFVHYKDFTKTVNSTTIAERDKNKDFLKHSTVVNDINIHKNGIVTNEGPNRTDIEKSSGKKVGTVNVDKLASGNKGRVKNGTDDTRKNISENDNGRKSKTIDKGNRNSDGSKHSDGNKTWGKKNRGNGTFKKGDGNTKKSYGRTRDGSRKSGDHSFKGSHGKGKSKSSDSKSGSKHHSRK